MDEIKFQVNYKQKMYTFNYGSEVYIFHTGIYSSFDRKYGIKALLRFVQFVHSCYLKDSNTTPLGSLADYVAENWKNVKQLDRYELLKRFYLQNGGF